MYFKLFGNDVNNVFALNGNGENSVTSALGWALSKSPTLLHAIIEKPSRKWRPYRAE